MLAASRLAANTLKFSSRKTVRGWLRRCGACVTRWPLRSRTSAWLCADPVRVEEPGQTRFGAGPGACKLSPMAKGALSDVVVLEFASGVAGPYCGKLLADLGAQ